MALRLLSKITLRVTSSIKEGLEIKDHILILDPQIILEQEKFQELNLTMNTTNNWSFLIENREMFKAFYEGDPNLSKVELEKLELSKNGHSCTITINLDSLPDILPKKWKMSKFNKTQISMKLYNVSRFELQGGFGADFSKVSFSKNGKLVGIAISSSNMSGVLHGEFLDLESVTGFTE